MKQVFGHQMDLSPILALSLKLHDLGAMLSI